MANAVYPLYKQNLLAGTAGYDIDVDTAQDGPYCALVDVGYVYGAGHNFFSETTPASNMVGTAQRITTPTVATGTFDGSDLTYTAVTGDQVTQLVIYRANSGANTTWPLVLKLDTGVTGLPVTPNGGNITITWNASGIFTLSDARAKEHVRQVGQHGPLGVYDYHYVGLPDRCRGFIAQEVEQYYPAAVMEIAGRKHVDYSAVA